MTAAPGDTLGRQLRRAAHLPDLSELTDGQLLARFLGAADPGDGGAAFEDLVKRHGPMVLGACRRVTGNHHDADDAFQAVFLVLVRRARELTDRATVGDWLYGVAYRTALKARAAAVKRRTREAAAARPAEAQLPDEHPDWLPVLDRELGRLPEKYREPIILCDLEGRTRKDVAGHLGVPEGTVSSRLAAGRKMLADRLRRQGVAVPVVALIGAAARTAEAVPPPLLDSTVRAAAISAGRAAGVVPVAVAKLTTEVTRAMFLTKLRAGIFALPLVLLLGVAVGAATRSGGEPVGNRNAKPAAAPPPPAPAAARDNRPAWRKDFDHIYGLADGEVLKRVPPPFPLCRADYVRDKKYVDEGGPFTPDDLRMLLRWDGMRTDQATLTFTVKGPVPPTWFRVGDVLRFATGASPVEVEGDQALLEAQAPGDFVVREGAAAGKVLPRLEMILQRECELPVKFWLSEVEREVVVVRGKFASTPREGREKYTIDVFSRRPIPDTRAGGGSGDLTRFLVGIESFTRRRLVNEVGQLPKDTLTWYFHLRSPFTAEERAEDTDPEAVFRTVAAQTGLTFETEKRKVRVLFVEKMDEKK
ncbi:MAG: sigma-70 family polymerase sigma factor [Gemmataceae bacterium]|nr:sigma-70 family polymerase sigma factor [Gemmataceae bacterium]